MDKLVYKLPVFEGPLDALLFLISKNKLNIYDIPIAELLDQYMDYLGTLEEMDMEVTSEFLEMASKLVEIKSAMLLPRKEEDPEDPRSELMQTLIGYQTCKAMAQALRIRETGFGCFVREPQPFEGVGVYRLKHDRLELLAAYNMVIKKIFRRQPPPATAFKAILTERPVSVASRIIHVLKRLIREGNRALNTLFSDAAGRSELVATFLAVLELVKSKKIIVERDNAVDVVKLRERNG